MIGRRRKRKGSLVEILKQANGIIISNGFQKRMSTVGYKERGCKSKVHGERGW